MVRRQTVLGSAFVLALVLAAFALEAVLGTLFLAGTVAYVAAVPYRWLIDRGLSPWPAGVVTTIGVYAASLLAVAPLVLVLYQRRGALLVFLASLAETYTFDILGMTVVITTADVVAAASVAVRDLALDLAATVPVLAVKFALFGLAVFALLLRGDEVRAALLAVVPSSYHGAALAVNERLRDTVFALYGLQVATAFGTFVVAAVVFRGLGYELYVTLAVVAALLQFIPIVGPSVLVAWLALAEFLAGDVEGALLVGVIGLVFIAALPDLLIRPRLAAYTADMPGSLYFIGFAGGVLTLGPLGVIAGPVVVALLAEVGTLLAAEHERLAADRPRTDA